MKHKLTPWFPGSVKPARDGVYQREYPYYRTILFCRYEKGQWHWASLSAKTAAKLRKTSGDQHLPWRGIAK